MIKNRLFSAIVVSSLLFSACHKDDNKTTNNNVITKSNVPMTSAQEVPTNTSTASATINYTYNKTTKMLNFTVAWTGLTGTPTGAHIHGIAPRGVNAGVQYNFFDAIPKTTAGTYTGSTMIDGVKIIEDSLLAGKYYMNIHTPANPGGEIRGQMEFK